ncbi:hypothetical protein [Acinetobacter indicus]|uniref:hypothetical protein n=1 Tax=Acinetobacter indicus TaxID=756892 RepID=UPI0025778776|nr:hypothetical protein [Acinetobacter indicus]MDM1286173.1 hypothetical protein [Acinetobacter indicus]
MGFSGRLQNWQGLKVWEGQVAEQLDLEKMQGSGLLLAGGEKQLYIDFGHPDNQTISRSGNILKTWLKFKKPIGMMPFFQKN